MCAGVTKGTCAGIFISKKMRFYEVVQNFLKNFCCVNLLITIAYYKSLTYISCNIHNYVPNQAISVAKSCFYCVFSLKNTT